ncbi:HDOD domain-containing protein [Methylocaldum sp. RMAD-M]|uniref:HDOD domain-containing protein n=1 Tax=Methylocaldum sp. RMAD-M TaxID=2806557 RepID=UPI000A31FEC2|nr:HDOD domain-containing protein [Methylocaldum sp. RMAD-M]MBP1152471.1 HD-like signal output (HDOD) protein [Methylocaldum sp. RMAD-M]
MTAQTLVKEVKTLASLPEVTLRVTQLMESPDSTNGAIGEVIVNDPALTARLLRLANSAFAGVPHKVETVSQAISLLGRDAVRDLVLATSVASTFRGIPPHWVDMERFWLNSIACGVIARSLAFRCRIFENEPLFIAGLLHKVGRLVFYSCRPDQYRSVLELSERGEDAINEAEQRIFGFTHAELGAELLRNWRLPERLQRAVAHYLEPSKAPADHRKNAALIHVASALASHIEPSVNLEDVLSTEKTGVDKGAWELLELSLDTVPNIIQDAWIQTFEVFEIIKPSFAVIH